MPVIKSKNFTLRPYKKSDEKSLILNINNKKIYRNMSRVPYPYTSKDANEWITQTFKKAKKKESNEVNFAIAVAGEVAGGISLFDISGHKAEIGYWLGENYWGQGIMSAACKLVTKFGLEKLKLIRIYAFVFPWNKASMKVLRWAYFG
ncbi:GNAT family N-acetyltransferase [Candidatus Falkowbacteria bacterium]|nr:GNAT family N-acetyltransferase [Candidatus Falkowbacteria bacterium]